MANQHTIFELWHYTFLFLSLAILAVFTVDMIGHQTKTLSTFVFTFAATAGFLVGELCLTLGSSLGENTNMALSIFLTLTVSILVALKLRIADPIVTAKRGQ